MTGKRPQTDIGTREPGESLEPRAVRDFLLRHPDFLNENPELLQVLTPPAHHSGGNVTDLGRFMARRLQEEVNRLKHRETALLETSRANQAVQACTMKAVLTMLDAASFEHLIHIVTRDLADVLDIDVITLCVEASGDGTPRRAPSGGVFVLEAGSIDVLLGPGQQVRLGAAFPGQEGVFGPAAGLVRSMALVRLSTSPRSPVGLMALGSRDAAKFQSGQGTELLAFLGRFLERLLRAWLDLPA